MIRVGGGGMSLTCLIVLHVKNVTLIVYCANELFEEGNTTDSKHQKIKTKVKL